MPAMPLAALAPRGGARGRRGDLDIRISEARLGRRACGGGERCDWSLPCRRRVHVVEGAGRLLVRSAGDGVGSGIARLQRRSTYRSLRRGRLELSRTIHGRVERDSFDGLGRNLDNLAASPSSCQCDRPAQQPVRTRAGAPYRTTRTSTSTSYATVLTSIASLAAASRRSLAGSRFLPNLNAVARAAGGSIRTAANRSRIPTPHRGQPGRAAAVKSLCCTAAEARFFGPLAPSRIFNFQLASLGMAVPTHSARGSGATLTWPCRAKMVRRAIAEVPYSSSSASQ